MYSAVMGDQCKLSQFLSATDADWVTFVCTQNGVLLIQDTSEIFAVLQLVANRSKSDSDVAFRVQKGLLKVILADMGKLEIEVHGNDGKVTFVFSTGENSRTLTTEIHQAFASTYVAKMQLVSTGNENQFNAECLKKISRIGSVFTQFVEVTGGIASMMARNGTRIYAKASGVPDCCLSFRAIKSLQLCGQEWSCIKNCVVAVKDGFGIVTTQCNSTGLASYDLNEAVKCKSAAVATIDFENMLPVFGKVSEGLVSVDLRKGICAVGTNNAKFSGTVKLIDVVMSDKYEGDLELSLKVLTSIFMKLSTSKITVSVKRQFLKIDCEEITLLCK